MGAFVCCQEARRDTSPKSNRMPSPSHNPRIPRGEHVIITKLSSLQMEENDHNEDEFKENGYTTRTSDSLPSDQMKEELISSQYLNIYEKGIIMTKEYIVQILESTLADSSWKNKSTKENFMLDVRSGSALCPSIMMVKMTVTLDEKFDCEDIIRTLFDKEYRKRWDTTLTTYDEIFNPNPSTAVVYSINKAPSPLQNRDFIEKRILFRHNDIYYCYWSATPNEIHPIVPEDKMVRGSTVFGGQYVKKLENGKIMCVGLTQVDLQIPAALNLMMNATLPIVLERWFKNFREALEKFKSEGL